MSWRGRQAVPESRRRGPNRNGLSPRRLQPICARDRRRCAARYAKRLWYLHDTSLGEEGKPMLGYEEKAERLKLIDAGRLARSLDKLLESLAHAEQLDPLDVERIPALRSISTRCAAHILKAQNKVLYAEERAGTRPSENQETQLRSKTIL